ncbi:ABC transporter permease [Nocardia sp. NEAU-G5]|uniref:ABC transporter permease n=1 Tax=Nocardia albiluteola TaxID=2842303 RepID=A0ABS6B473_9NOCA|nr:ABC transporter permease [Nocardia albiluteola]MBU3065049.1 ABC transporter permease [Nocardia albiluteola]
MSTSALDNALPARRTRRGGFSWGFFALELRQAIRNKRTLIVALVLPPAIFLSYGTRSGLRSQAYGSGNFTAYAMVSMALYGAMLATTSGGAAVALERAAGWSRQLRLTPLRPVLYIATKLMLAMVLGFLSVAAVFAVGAAVGARLPAAAWVGCFAMAWIGSLIFAAFGLFMGYLLPPASVVQILSLVLAALSFAGGAFIPLHGWALQVSRIFPTGGLATLARLPFEHSSGVVVALAVVNVVFWAAVFTGGAALMFRRDTAR